MTSVACVISHFISTLGAFPPILFVTSQRAYYFSRRGLSRETLSSIHA